MSNLCSKFPLAPVQNASLQLNEITTQREMPEALAVQTRTESMNSR